MGPSKDDRIADLYVAELRKIKAFDWEFMGAVYSLGRAAEAAWSKRNGEPPVGKGRTLQIPALGGRPREMTLLAYGMLVGQQPDAIDWAAFRDKFDEGMWAFDAMDF